MKLKKTASLFVFMAMIVGLLAGCGGGGGSSAPAAKDPNAKVKVKIANIYGADTYESKSMVKFKEIVEKKNKNITVEVYTNSQLGNEEALTDSVRQGSVEIVLVGTLMAQYIPNISVAECPFLFDGWKDSKAVLSDEKFIKMSTTGIEKQGIKFLGFNPVGFRTVSSNKIIKSMDDFKGLRLRTPNIPVYLTMGQSFGANAIAMPLTELFTALEQKVVDAQENPPNVIIANKFYEVQPFLLESKHMLTTHGWYTNSKFLDGLSEENRKIILDSAAEAIEYCWQITEAGENDEIAYLKKQNVTVTVPDDAFKKQMRDSQKPVVDWYLGKYPDSKEMFAYVEQLRAAKK